MNRHSMEAVDYDVVVVGGGMVGSMLAAALATHQSKTLALKIAVLENHQPDAFEPGSHPPYDIRVSALSIATQRMFENVGAWQGVLDRRACAYNEMLVWDGEAAGRTHFRSSDVGASELGHIVENRVIQLALLDRLQQATNVDYLCPSSLVAYQNVGERVSCQISSQQAPITTRLLVGADGARSTVRELAGIAIDRESYPQHALVATVETLLPQQEITWQRFQPTGPEAMLPLCGSNASLVWYNAEEEVQRLRALSDESFIEAIDAAFPEELGGIKRVIERSSFPLTKAHARSYIAERTALIGDAAHTVHPLAGQGVNLGMLDAAALAEVILDAHGSGQDIGNHRLLRRYERWRRGENKLMIAVFDGFYHAFKPQSAPIRRIRSAALDFADSAKPVKRLVMRHAMGTAGHLPVLAQ